VTRLRAAGHSYENEPVSAALGIRLENEPENRAEALGLDADLAAIYRAHFTLVWRGLRRLGVPDPLLEDAAQEVFLVVHRRAADFRGRSSLRTWIYGIVVRVAKDFRRAERRHSHRVEQLAESLSVAPPRVATPAEEAERREANQLLHLILLSLSEELREVLVLVELEQLPVREATIVLDVGVRTCHRRLRAAHAEFERKLATHLGRRTDDGT